ncbi:MAG: hypothetical protein A3K19_22895 [Lentisphaerae bacterium RIFOXYB12_FULL_65_16]|nr:MAG: hypothetical protein A3K18_16860 [Lentisphaerae bacterium RIFOXYA12_64_32]OGV90057.1 MAG: hypothetical protein A3K19_22895 [Lentisphaerae bacterium RIFOXYB12_FULL_65_16]
MSNDRIVLLDGYGHIYRSFYGVRELNNARGEPTNALFALSRFLLRFDQDFPHRYGAFVLDKGRPAKRMAALPTYKANRPPMPDDLRRQLAPIRDWVQAAGWAILEEEGREADDLIAAVVEARESHETLIVSQDKDLAQLVRPGVSLVLPGKKGEYDVLGEPGVREKFGIAPTAMVDYQMLVGDTSDNVPGVPGVGAKTAVKLLTEFGSVEALLANVDAIRNPAVREKIRVSAELLARNRQLVALDAQLPAGWTGVEALRRRSPDWDRLLAMARDNGFNSMVGTLEKARQDARSPSLFSLQ